MQTSLAVTALLMGLAGGPHCIAMCGASCAGIGKAAGTRGTSAIWTFQAGRLASYSALGAVAAASMQGLGWLTTQTAALRPVWTLMHVAVLAWGLMMVLQARQPVWVEQAGRSVWSRVQPLVRAPGGVFVTGFLWALMPCGLLYSALLVAALSGGAWQGALSMALFGVGSGVWLLAGPWLWQHLRARMNVLRASWGTRFAGLLLMGVACWALWMDLVYRPSLICQ